MLVMGGIVGSGIFMNPYVVAQQVHTEALILGVWLFGGLLAMAGAFIWAELACRLPGTGGQYLYLKEAYHPSVAFLYGWVLLLVAQTGGMAAVALTFARYARELTGITASDGVIAATTLLALTIVNCFGARIGSNVQSAFMLLKSLAIAALVVAGFSLHGALTGALGAPAQLSTGRGMLGNLGAAMIPVAFAYGGWQTSSFIAGEMRNPKRDLSRGLIIGVLGVIVLYVSVNWVCLHALGPAGLAATKTPASAVMRAAWGDAGARWIAFGIAFSTVGLLSQGILTTPRVYSAMAQDGLFFQIVGWVWPRTGAPVVAILLQGLMATLIAVAGRYEQILNFAISIDFTSFAVAAAALFVLRRKQKEMPEYRVPGYPLVPAFFVLACLGIVASTLISYPENSLIGWVILLAGYPVYLFWSRKKRAA
jgi:APA family basic amino acid/polyamine antiporter